MLRPVLAEDKRSSYITLRVTPAGQLLTGGTCTLQARGASAQSIQDCCRLRNSHRQASTIVSTALKYGIHSASDMAEMICSNYRCDKLSMNNRTAVRAVRRSP